jgi:arginase
LRLEKAITGIIKQGNFPVVLGGDCSILIGCMLALRRLGRYGLFFIDGHADFFQPEAEPNGEVASMELAIVSGRGPEILTDIDNLKPFVQDENIVTFGYRDLADQKEYGSQDISKTRINNFDFSKVKALGCSNAAQMAIAILLEKKLNGFWIHCDVDVLNDEIMPAVDYRMPGGLQWYELTKLLSLLTKSGNSVGITITIFNPTLDPDGAIATKLSHCITDGLSYYSIL